MTALFTRRATFFLCFCLTIMMPRARAAVKDLWILRHGQATHNPRAEAARAGGCSFEEFLELMRQSDSLDSELTDLGKRQAQSVLEKYGNYWIGAQRQPPELVVSSPLSRALQTADLAVPMVQERVCYEELREINGWLLNAKRRSIADLSRRFPNWNFGLLESEEDHLWTDELESNEDCRERGFIALQRLLGRPESSIVLVAHGGILRQTMAEHPDVLVEDGRLNRESDRSADARFDNCELRRYHIGWSHDHSSSTEKDGSSRRIIVLTEVDFDHDHAEEAECNVAAQT